MLHLVMQAAPTGGGALAAQILPLILIGFIFYFLLIRPQNQRMKAHRAMLEAITRGETVVTNGGLIGKVVKVTDTELTIDLGNAQKVRVVRSMIADVRDRAAPANDRVEKANKKK